MNLQRILSAFVTLVLLGISLSAGGHGYRLGDMLIQHPWALPTRSTDGTGYLTLNNRSAEDDRLIAVSTAVAAKAALYAPTKIKTGDGLKTEPVDAINVPAGQDIKLKPGGLHIRFIGLTQPLADGDHFSVILKFQNVGEIAVDMFVQQAAKNSVY